MVTKILFVCSGNVFRSMSAEYCLKRYCELHKIDDLEMSSAGTHGDKKQDIRKEVIEELKKLGINASTHNPRRLTKEMLDSNDLIVAMGFNHKKHIKEEFGYHSVLFEEVCLGNKEPILDNNEALKDKRGFLGDMYDRQMARNIWDDTPYFIKNYRRFV